MQSYNLISSEFERIPKQFKNLDDEKKVQYKLVGEDEADLKIGKISITSPLARSLIGKDQDDVIELKMPNGITEYEIIKVAYE